MPGDSYPPYRKACNNKPLPTCGLGPLFKHGKAVEKNLDRYVNTTVVQNWNPDDTDHPTSPPYERWTQDLSGGESCEVHHCVADGAPCSEWPKSYTANTFTHTLGDKVDLSTCRKRGFKNVQARRFWSGSYGYMHSTGPDTTQACSDGTLKSWLSYQSAPPTSKYLNLAITAELKESQFNYDEEGAATEQVNIHDTASVNQSINPTSGLLTISDFEASPSDDRNRALPLMAYALWTREAIVARMTVPISSPLGSGTFAYSDNSYVATADFGDGPYNIETGNWDIAAGTFIKKQFQMVGSTLVQWSEEMVTLTDSSFTYAEWDSTLGGGTDGTSPTATEWMNVSGTFSGSNTSASLLADIKNNLLSLWPLNDDALYPWRTDIKVSVSPLVSRETKFSPRASPQTSTSKTTAHPSQMTPALTWVPPLAMPHGMAIADSSWLPILTRAFASKRLTLP